MLKVKEVSNLEEASTEEVDLSEPSSLNYGYVLQNQNQTLQCQLELMEMTLKSRNPAAFLIQKMEDYP